MLTIEEYYEQWAYQDCPYDHNCTDCDYDCGDDIL